MVEFRRQGESESFALSDGVPSFGCLIKAARLKRNLTLDELSVQADVSRAFLALIEKGRKLPSVETTALMADALHLNPHKLLLARLNAVMPDGFVVIDKDGNTFPCQYGGFAPQRYKRRFIKETSQ